MAYFDELKTIEHKTISKTKITLKPYSNNEQEIAPVCKKIIGKFRIMIHKPWHGNGFGQDSLIFVWNTEENIVKKTKDSYSKVVNNLL